MSKILPSKLSIGCYDYDVFVTDEMLLVDDKKCRGMIDYCTHQIKLDGSSNISDQAREQTLWHEIIHGIINYRKVTYGKNEEEFFIDELAIGLYLLCKNNGLLPGQNQWR